VNDIQELRRRLNEALDENLHLREQLKGNVPVATWWLQRKCDAQRQALDVLNRRVVSQRFQLRTINAAGRGLTADEYRTARSAEQNEQLRERIDEQPVAV
jgi:hypothetical protein